MSFYLVVRHSVYIRGYSHNVGIIRERMHKLYTWPPLPNHLIDTNTCHPSFDHFTNAAGVHTETYLQLLQIWFAREFRHEFLA